MKTIRIGCGAGFSGDRIEPAVELATRGDLHYLVFECLAERTIALAQQAKARDPHSGYDPLLVPRMESVLPASVERGVRIVTNMGAANPVAAGTRVESVARKLGLRGMAIAIVTGDDVLDLVKEKRSGRRRDGSTGCRARRSARVGKRLHRRRANRRGPCARRDGRDHGPLGRPVAVRRSPGARVRLGERRLGRAGPRHARRPPAGMRRTDHGRLLRRPGFQGRRRLEPAWIPDCRSARRRAGRDHQGERLGGTGDAGDLQGAAALRDPRSRRLRHA